ncbi:MAG: hypothetical protein DMG81_06645 [Acidobacteria bacterium]|nr:MAG: hypothetical protein DMG81_06645 [Acidobacteriota bacterium]
MSVGSSHPLEFWSSRERGDMSFAKLKATRGLSAFAAVALVSAALMGTACNKANDSYKDRVKTALDQADLKELGGTLHSDDAKNRAADVAQSNAGPRIIANEISVEPVGNEGQARKMESNLDDGIENNYKAVLISKGLDRQHIRYNAKNGVLTLKGSVKDPTQRQEAQELAKNTPNVQQVVNEIQIQR